MSDPQKLEPLVFVMRQDLRNVQQKGDLIPAAVETPLLKVTFVLATFITCPEASHSNGVCPSEC